MLHVNVTWKVFQIQRRFTTGYVCTPYLYGRHSRQSTQEEREDLGHGGERDVGRHQRERLGKPNVHVDALVHRLECRDDDEHVVNADGQHQEGNHLNT